MHPALKAALVIACVVALFKMFPALLVIAVLLLVIWLLMNLSTHGLVWFLWQRDAAVLRMGKFGWFRILPGVTPTLRRVERKEAEREAERKRQVAEWEPEIEDWKRR